LPGSFRVTQALAHTATAFSKEPNAHDMVPVFTAGLFGMGRRLVVRTSGGSYRSSAGLYGFSLSRGVLTPVTPFAEVHAALSGQEMGGIPAVIRSFISECVSMKVRKYWHPWPRFRAGQEALSERAWSLCSRNRISFCGPLFESVAEIRRRPRRHAHCTLAILKRNPGRCPDLDLLDDI
jgi:hypothetical protein